MSKDRYTKRSSRDREESRYRDGRSSRSERQKRYSSPDRQGRSAKRPQENSRTEKREGNINEKPYDSRMETYTAADSAAQESVDFIEGRNAVIEAFRAGRVVERVWLEEGLHDGPIETIDRLAARAKVRVDRVPKARLDSMGSGRHQGAAARISPVEYADLYEVLDKADEKGETPFLILLDEIEDPHNLGAMIRTANQVGATAVVIPKNRAVGITSTVVKTSAGAVYYTPVVKVTNLVRTMQELKEKGFWFACADMDGEVMYRQNLTGPLGLVIGNEGQGVSRLVRENCDFTVSVPMKGQVDSLNASVACGVLAYEVLRQREYRQN